MYEHLKSQTLPELTATLKELGLPAFRGKQVYTWLHKGVKSFDEMTNLSKSLRSKLEENCYITVPTVARKQVSQLDGTIKYLFGLSDGNSIETVLMKYEHGNSICISTQAGCKMGCVFCASFDPARSRNLTPAEILDEILFAQKDSGRKISNIVLMGIGEPLDNWDQVMRFLTLVNHPDVIMADEPSGSLDSQNKEDLHKLFFDLRDRFGQTFIIVTHDENLAMLTDRTIRMVDGVVVDDTGVK